jgi:hypothetical protein
MERRKIMPSKRRVELGFSPHFDGRKWKKNEEDEEKTKRG